MVIETTETVIDPASLTLEQFELYDVSTMSNDELRNFTARFVNSHERDVLYLDLHNWDVSNFTSFEQLFMNFRYVVSIDVSGWDVSNVRNFKRMFCNCVELRNIHGLYDWNMSNAVNLDNMFQHCSELLELHLPWNVSNVQTMGYMFAYCGNLVRIHDVEHWRFAAIPQSTGIFTGCLNLHISDENGTCIYDHWYEGLDI